MQVQVKLLPHAKDFTLPRPQSRHAAGVDLHAAIPRPLLIMSKNMVIVPTGLSVAIPPGFEGQVRPRSGLAAKNWLTVLNSPGTIDADYRGEIQVLLINHGGIDCTVQPCDRIAQLVIAPVIHADWELVDELDETERGAGGFGSTGTSQLPPGPPALSAAPGNFGAPGYSDDGTERREREPRRLSSSRYYDDCFFF